METTEQKQNQMYAICVLCGTLLFMFITPFSFKPAFDSGYDAFATNLDAATNFTALFFSLVLGASVYLMLQSSTKCRLFAGVGLLLGSLLHALSSLLLIIYSSIGKMPAIGLALRHGQFRTIAQTGLIEAVAVGIIAVIIAVVIKNDSKRKLAFAACISAVTVAALRILNLLSLANAAMPPARKIGAFAVDIGFALSIILFAFIIYMLCTLKTKELKSGAGAKVWLGLCAAFTTITIIAGFVMKTSGVASALVTAVGIAGYILLLCSKRAGFLLIMLSVGLTVISGIGAGLTGHYASLANTLIPFVGLINPLITWLIIRKNWKSVESERV